MNLNYASKDCVVYVIENFFEGNGGTFSGCIDVEIKAGWFISLNNIIIANVAKYDAGAGSVYSLRGGFSVCKGDKYIANFGLLKGKTQLRHLFKYLFLIKLK